MVAPTLEEITNDVRASAEDGIAATLFTWYRAFDPAIKKGNEPTREQVREMAQSLSRKGEFETISGAIVKREDVISKLGELAQNAPELKDTFGNVMKNLQDMPDNETVQKISSSIYQGIEKSTEVFGKDKSFWEILGSLLEMAINYIMGVIDYWMDGRKNNKDMMECIGERFAASTTDKVKTELLAQSASDEKVAAILTPERIEQIGERVSAKVVSTFSGKNISTAGTTLLSQAVMKEDPIRGAVLENVKSTVDKFFQKDLPGTQANETGEARKALANNGVSVASINEVQEAFQETLKEIVKDKNHIKSDPDTLRKAIAKGVTDKLDWDVRGKSWYPTDAGYWTAEQGGEAALREAIEMGKDGKSMLDEAAVKKLQAATELYHKGLSSNTPSQMPGANENKTPPPTPAPEQMAGARASRNGP